LHIPTPSVQLDITLSRFPTLGITIAPIVLGKGILLFKKDNPKLMLSLNGADLPARVNILFDATSSLHLGTESLNVLGNNMAEKIFS